MANLCSYDLYAKGTKEGLLKLRRMLEQEEKPYVINAKYCSELAAGRIRKNEDGSYSQKFSSATRWSVAGAMLDERRNSDEYCTLQRAAELTGTELELYSEEPGCCFAEHIRISPDGRGTIEERPFYLFFNRIASRQRPGLIRMKSSLRNTLPNIWPTQVPMSRRSY